MENEQILDAINALDDRKGKTLNAWLLLVGSLVAFAGVGLFQWDLEYLVLLAVAIFLHELGHLAAMKLFRYKNLKMLFLPFFGGLASGESKERHATKIAWISLFGPLAGFASCYLALGIWYLTRFDVLLTYAYLSLVINAFNLLPIMPLDGGHFLNETLFSRFPVAELVFKILAVVGMTALAYTLGSWILGLVAFLVFAGLGISYKLSRAASNLRKEGDSTGGELTVEKIRRIREELRAASPHFESEKNIQNLPRVVQSTWIQMNKTFPSLGTTIGLLAAYLTTLFGLTVATFLAIHLLSGGRDIPA